MLKKNVMRLLSVVLVCMLVMPLTAFGAVEVTAGDVTSHTTTGKIYSMAKIGNYLYSGGENGLEIFDFSTTPATEVTLPADHELAGLVVDNGKQSVYYDGTYLYISAKKNNVRYIYQCSVENPASPAVVKTFQGYGAVDMAVKNGWLYTANSGGRMYAYELASATTKNFFLSGASALAIKDNTIYVAYTGSSPAKSGIFAFDISNPGGLYPNKTLEKWQETLSVGELCRGYRLLDTTVAKFNQLKVQGNYLYASETQNKKIYRIDVSDPANISNEAKWKEFYAGESNSSFRAFDIDEQYLYLYQGSNVKVLNLATGDVLITKPVTDDCNDISAENGAVYVASKNSSAIKTFAVLDVAVTIEPYGVSTRDLESADSINDTNKNLRIYGMAAYENYLYVLGRAAGVVIYDITNPAAPSQVGAITGYGDSRSDRDAICVYGNYLYCGYQDHKIRKFDLTTPEEPVLKTTFNNQSSDGSITITNLRQIVVTDKYVIAGNGGNTARWDNTSAAEEVYADTARYNLGNISHIEIQGDYMYCMSYDGTVRMYEIAASGTTINQKVNIQNLKDSNTNRSEQAITLDDAGYLYGINGSKLSVYNTTGANTTFYNNEDYITCTYDILANTTDCFVKDGFLYALSSSNNVTVFDVSEPFAPVLVSNSLAVTAGGGLINGDYFYTFAPGGLDSGVKVNIFKFTESARPTGGAIVSKLPVKLSGTAKGTDSVNFVLDNGASVSVPVVNGKWTYSLNTLTVGYHTVAVSVPGTSLSEELTISMPKYLAESFTFNTDRIAAGEKLSVSCKVSNTTDKAARPFLIIALYSDDELKDVNFVRPEIAGGESQLLTASLTLPDSVLGYSAKAFIWDDAESITPLSTELELQ